MNFKALPLLAALLATPSLAQAEEVSSTAKGIIGGSLLGAEIVVIPLGIAQVRSPVVYAVGAGLGAIGGGIAGYFIEDASTDGRAPTYMLAGGLALIIPATVLLLNATRYQPPEDSKVDRTHDAPADPGARGGSSVQPGAAPAPAADPASPASQPAPATAPSPGTTSSLDARRSPVAFSLFDVGAKGGSGFRFGLPMPEVRPVYTFLEQAKLGIPQQTEVRFPLVRGRF